MRALDAAQIDGDLALRAALSIGFAEIMPQQDIFGRDGGVGLELEHPMAVRALQVEQRIGRRADRAFASGAGARAKPWWMYRSSINWP